MYERFCEGNDCAEPQSQLVVFRPDANITSLLYLEQDVELTQSYTKVNPVQVEAAALSFDKIFAIVRTSVIQESGFIQNLFKITHFAENGEVYQLYQRGNNLDVTSFDLIQMEEKTTDALRDMLDDDVLLQEGQVITASDGKEFKLVGAGRYTLDIRRMSSSGGVGLGDEVSLLYDAGNKPDRLVLRVNGQEIIYQIDITDEGIVLDRLTPTSEPRALRFNGEDLMSIRHSSSTGKPYSLIYQGKEYLSGFDGFINLDSGTRVRWSRNYLTRETLEVYEPGGNIHQLSFQFGGSVWKLVGVETDVYVDGQYKSNIIANFEKKSIRRSDFNPVSSVSQIDEYYILKTEENVEENVSVDIEAGTVSYFEGMMPVPSSDERLFVYYLKTEPLSDAPLYVIRFQEDGQWYKVWTVGTPDVTPEELLSLPLNDRDGGHFRALISDDLININ